MSCCSSVSACCCLCCHKEEEADDDDDKLKGFKRKGVYCQVPDSEVQQDIVLPEFHKVPLEKVFQFAQPQVPLSIHPQIRKMSEIKEQPTTFFPVTVGTISRRASLFEESNFCYSPLRSNSPKTFELQVSYPKVNFSMLYDIQTCSLTVHLVSAENLPSIKKSAIDFFVLLFLLPHREDIFRSKTCYKTQNPVFDETFVFGNILYNEINDRTLVLRVLSQNHVVGNVILPLYKTELHGVQVSAVLNEDTDTEQSSTNGDIQVILRYDTSVSEFSGLIIKASNLKKMDITGLSDPYVIIKVYHKGKKKYKWKSTVKKKTLSPTFNEDFAFDFTDMATEDIVVKLIMKDEDLFSKDDLMGMVEFGDYVDHPTGRAHWKEVMASPNTRITKWHSLDQQSGGIFQLLSLRSSKPH